jgi:HSP20 family molecular chaperone IbpA
VIPFVSVVPMPNNPYDEFLKNLAKMVEEVIRSMPDGDSARFIGCTIISGNPGELPAPFAISQSSNEELHYEVIETEDRIFITAEIPPDNRSAVYADIKPTRVEIVAGEQRTGIDLDAPVDLIHSFYQVRHGVMDIILKKGPTRAEWQGKF